MKTTIYNNDKIIYVHEHLRGLAFDDAIECVKSMLANVYDTCRKADNAHLIAITESKTRKTKVELKFDIEVIK